MGKKIIQNKKVVTATIITITLLIMWIMVSAFLPHAKYKGGYSDTLENDKVVLRIVSTNIIKENNKEIFEVVTSIWNKDSKSLEITNQAFNYNDSNPSNNILLTIKSNERISVRQTFDYVGIVNKYEVNLHERVFNFDFTLRNNELKNMNVKLATVESNNVKDAMERQAIEASNVRTEYTSTNNKETAELKANAEKMKATDQATSNTVDTNVFATYYSNVVGDNSTITIQSDLTAIIDIQCQETPIRLETDKLKVSNVNNVYHFEGNYQYDNKTQKVEFSYDKGSVGITKINVACMLDSKFIR